MAHGFRNAAIVIGLFTLLVFPKTIVGQIAGVGLPPFGSFSGGGTDTVNLENLNVNLSVPVVSHPGRGSSFQYNLAYNSLIWVPSGGTSSSWISPTHSYGWEADGPGGLLQLQKGQSDICPGQITTEWTGYAFTDANGTTHPFSVFHFSPNACNTVSADTGYAIDGSGYFIDVSNTSNPLVRNPDGTKFVFSGSPGVTEVENPAITDANGNQITSTVNPTTGEVDWKDTLGQIALTVTTQSNGSGGLSERDYNRLAVDGTYQTIAVKYEFLSVKTNFGLQASVNLPLPA
jgi:hypothetical protein